MLLIQNQSVENVSKAIDLHVERNKQREKDLRTLGELMIMAALMNKDEKENGLS